MLRRYRLVSAAAGLTALCLVAAGPAAGVGTRPAAAPGPLCTAGSTTTKGDVIAGYTVTALAAGLRYQVNSPGLLPIGDAQVGTIDETDVPFARTTVDSGPVIDSLAAPGYPGDTLARIGSVFGQFGAPGVPNPPIVAESNYPSSPTYGTSATFNRPAAAGAGAFTGSSTATATGANATATVATVSLAQAPSGGAPVQASSSDTSTASQIGPACVDGSAHAHTGKVSIAGLIQIDGITADATARSNGTAAVPTATLKVGHVTVAGLDAYIDGSGIHLASQQAVGGAVVQLVTSQLQHALSSAGLGIRVLSPTTTVKGGMATADSGGLEITLAQNFPGVAALQVPPVPLRVIAEYGAASATAAASVAPAPGSLTPPVTAGGTVVPPAPIAVGGVAPTGGDSGLGSAAPVVPSGGTEVTNTAPPAGTPTSGGEVFSATPAVSTPLGRSAPIGWILVGILVAVSLIAPMLGYARWQLLEGRI